MNDATQSATGGAPAAQSPSVPTAVGTGSGDPLGDAMAREKATAQPYAGDPMLPSPQLLRKIAEATKPDENGDDVARWSAAFAAQYPNA